MSLNLIIAGERVGPSLVIYCSLLQDRRVGLSLLILLLFVTGERVGQSLVIYCNLLHERRIG